MSQSEEPQQNQQPPLDLQKWGEPITPEDQLLLDQIEGRAPASVRDSGRPVNRVPQDGLKDMKQYGQLVHNELAEELRVFATRDGNESLSRQELIDYLASSGAQGAYEGYTRYVYNLARDAQSQARESVRDGTFLREDDSALGLLLENLDNGVNIADIAYAPDLRDGVKDILLSTPTLPAINAPERER